MPWKKRAALVVAVACLAALPAMAQEDSAEVRPVGFWVGLANSVLPGLVQVVNGQPEGWAYMIGGPLMIAGSVLQVDYLLDPEEATLWELGLSLPLSDIGGSLYAYSEYAYARDLRNSPALAGVEDRRPREPYLSLLAAPFRPRNVFHPGVIAVLGLMQVPYFSYDVYQAARDYFARPSVSFFGLEVTPAAGLGLQAVWSMVLNLFVATFEEVLFRGLYLDTLGPTASAITFGAMHLGNVFLPPDPETPWYDPDNVVGVVAQSAFATCFGFYANILTAADSYRLQRPIALHYWNNVVAMTMGYLLGEGVGGP